MVQRDPQVLHGTLDISVVHQLPERRPAVAQANGLERGQLVQAGGC